MAFLALAILGLVRTEDVITGTGSNFEKTIKDNDFVVAEFYAPWCGHCKSLAPEYEKAAGILKKEKTGIVLMKVDATEEENKALAEKYGVRGFPTLKIFRGGDLEGPIEYNGPREADGIVSYLKKQSGPASVPIKTAKEVAEFKAKPAAVVGVFKGEDAPEFKVFSDVANALRDDFDFAHTFEAKIVDEIKKAPGVVLYKDFDEPMLKYDGKFEKAALLAWVDAKSQPSLPELNQEPKNKKVLQKIFEKQDPKLLAFIAKGNKDEAAFKKVLSEANAKSSKVDIILAETGANAGALKFFGLEEEDTPAFAIHHPAEDGKFIKKNVTPKDLKSWLAEFEAGKLVRFIKSEEAPATNDGPVKILTANTFTDIVFAGKNVMVEFYAPWCGHCKTLAPIYEELGEAFEDDDTVVIAKMDATANDVPDKRFEVKGFPTLVFVKADGTLLPFSGDRKLDAMTDFIKENSGATSNSSEEDAAEAQVILEKPLPIADDEPAKDEL